MHKTNNLNDYLLTRLDEINVNIDEITISTLQYDSSKQKNVHTNSKLLDNDKDGNITIKYHYLDGNIVSEQRKGTKQKKKYVRTRFNPQSLKKGDPKYKTPYGLSTRPFFPPYLIKAYQEKKTFDTIYITEGEFKSIVAGKYAIPCIGIQGIFNYKSGKELHPEIADAIEYFKAKNIVLLYDADCKDISKHLEAGKDLYKRLNNFYSACRNFRELTKELNIDVYFSHILENQSNSKGLDDLLTNTKNKERIIDDLVSLRSSDTFFFLNVSANNLNKLFTHFSIKNANIFYEEYQEIIQDKEFVFKNAKYKFNGSKLDVIKIPEANEYIRIGTRYYKVGKQPTINGSFKETLLEWNSSTIKEDYKHIAPNIIQMITKYDGYCNVPSHTNYQKVLNKFYNLYSELPKKPTSFDNLNDIEVSLNFVKHIFGEQWEMGLDYIQLLYKEPTMNLPILCLVSEENATGKSTFCTWLHKIFGNNATKIDMSDFESQFNDHYVGKLLIYIEETASKKMEVKERIKDLSTSTFIKMEAKGLAKVETQFFGKFILCSNHETKFLNIDRTDTRFWIKKVPVITEFVDNFQEALEEEIPAFLSFLEQREMFVKQSESRMYFSFYRIKTPEFDRIVKTSRTVLEKVIIEYFYELFSLLPEGENEILYPRKALIDQLRIRENISKGSHAIAETLKDKLKISTLGKKTRFKYPVLVEDDLSINEKGYLWYNAQNDPYVITREHILDLVEN